MNARDTLSMEIAELRIQLREAHDTLAAIQSGDVDALVVGTDIYTLDSANAAANKMRQDVLSQMEDAVVAFDNDGNLVYMNPSAERLYGKDASHTLGRPKAEVFEESWADDGARASADEQLGAQGRFQAVSVHRTARGARVHVETSVSLLRDGAGRPAGQLYVIRNISDRVAAEQALQAADRQKDEFLATLAHELRNPLAPIRNALEIMRRDPAGDAQGHARRIIERQLGHLVHLVDDLLDVSRISQGKVQLRVERADLNQAVHAALETTRPVVQSAGHTLDVRLPPPATLMVDADVTRLSQVIANLLNNAAKYTPEGGRIVVSATREGDQAVLTVSDSGVGIPVDFIPRVFDLFAQVDSSMARAQGGLGIGLALVKRLVDLHGGTVQARSEGVNQGSEFTVRLPLSRGTAEPRRGAVEQPLPATPAADVRVLIVDDNVDGAQTLAEVLMLEGHATQTAYDGAQALSAVQSFRPRVVILDIGLPDMSGHEVARRIRMQPGGDAVTLIALSGWGQDEDRRKSADAGFDLHLVKPVDFQALMAAVAMPRH